MGEGSAWGWVTSAGGRLVVAEYGVVLTIPSGALPPDTRQQFYVTVDSCAGNTPTLTDRQVCSFYHNSILITFTMNLISVMEPKEYGYVTNITSTFLLYRLSYFCLQLKKC